MHGRILGLDGLRALSVFLVIMSHGVVWQRLGITDHRFLAVFSADNGVKVFFILSGFLITLLLLREDDATGRIDVPHFFARRILRIFPLYFLSIALLFTMDQIGASRISSCTFTHALTYTVNFAPEECRFQSTSHFWSLAVEEHFYLFWPLLFALGKRVALAAAIVISVAGIVLEPYLIQVFPTEQVNRWTFPAMAPITIGCISAFIATYKGTVNVFQISYIKPLILFLIAVGLSIPAYRPNDILWLSSVALLVLFIQFNQKSILVKALEIKPLVIIGTMSYGLYVWQGIFTGNGPYRLSSQNFPPSLDTGIVLTFVIAPLSYWFFERPILKLKRHFRWQSGPKGSGHSTDTAEPLQPNVILPVSKR